MRRGFVLTPPHITVMCGGVIQSSAPIRLAILDVRDSRIHNYPPRWNSAVHGICRSHGACLYLLEIKEPFDVRWFHFFVSSVARAFLTFDWETPNCRAILAGVMPAL